jgi:hypothetical protein
MTRKSQSHPGERWIVSCCALNKRVKRSSTVEEVEVIPGFRSPFWPTGAVPGLVGRMCPEYGISRTSGHRSRDTNNAETFIKEFQEFERNGTLPRFIVMSLGEDHTTGTHPGTFTPQACGASNDLALGRIVEASPTASPGPRRRSSSSRTTRRTARTRSMPTAPWAW